MNAATPLPHTVVRYFDLMDRNQKTGVVDLFTSNAQVTDDGRTYRGRDEILGWLAGPASEYTTTSTQLSAEGTDSTVTVEIRIEGNFPGGVVDLRNTFALDPSGLITTLSIAP